MSYPKDSDFKKQLELHSDLLNASKATQEEKDDIAKKFGCPDYKTFITLTTLSAQISEIRYQHNYRKSKTLPEDKIHKLSELFNKRDTLIQEKKVDVDI